MKQWAWIARQIRKGTKLKVGNLKNKWLENNGFSPTAISSNCFFCEYNEKNASKNVCR